MGIITTYVCDVSGKQGKQEDFVEVKINTTNYNDQYRRNHTITKMVHIDVAKKLNLIALNVAEKEANPEPTLESKLIVLLKEYIGDIAYESAQEAISNRN